MPSQRKKIITVPSKNNNSNQDKDGSYLKPSSQLQTQLSYR